MTTADDSRSMPRKLLKRPGNAERLRALENVMWMISDSENVLTAVVVGVAVEEAEALIHADQDQGHLHHIVETRDRLRDDEEIHRAETRRHAGTETCMFQEREEVAGQVMVGTGQFRDRRQLEVVDMAGEQVQVQVVEVNAMEDQRRDQSLALSVARH
jgi:hypothetical protein